MTKQTPADRLLKLSAGKCPVHGIWMPQIDTWYYADTGERYFWPEENADRAIFTIVECPWNNCGIQAKAFSNDGPWELTEKWEHLLVDPEKKIIQFPIHKIKGRFK
ncbi:hypothetical protein QUF70_13725 [Desulfobacterales bacterium HSG17]|nr:hypothetical protein [Desulfobacterales bacterium HSG17]